MKKIIIIIAIVLVAAGAGLYFFVFSAEPPEKIYSFYEPGDYFVANIMDSSSLIKTTIVLELYVQESELDEITEYLKKNNHIIREIIVFKLRSKTEDELRSQGIDEILRDEIVKSISTQMDIDYISSVYFNDYVVQ